MRYYSSSGYTYFTTLLKAAISKGLFTKSIFTTVPNLLFVVILVLISCGKDGNDNISAVNIDPVINIVSPLSGTKNTQITITGAHFGTNISKTFVYFNGISAVVTSVNDGTIVCNVPVKPGNGIVKVVVANGKEAKGPSFTYQWTGNVTTLAGGTNGYVDATGAAAQFGESQGLCSDALGNIYMVDYYNSKVRMITPAGVVTTVAGGALGYADGTGTAALFSAPTGICSDGHGNFFISDTYDYTIRKMTTTGIVTTVAGSPVSGYQDGNGTVARFYNAVGICIDATGNLYIADVGNNKIRKIDISGNVTTLAGSIVGFADGAGPSAKFDSPIGICVDAQGNVYVSEFLNHKIRKITPAGTVTTLAGSTAGFADGTGTNAQFQSPAGMCIDTNGNIYVADSNNNSIRMITPSGVVTTIAGFTSTEFFFPLGICIDPQGILYVMDTYNYRIRKVVLD